MEKGELVFKCFLCFKEQMVYMIEIYEMHVSNQPFETCLSNGHKSHYSKNPYSIGNVMFLIWNLFLVQKEV